MEVCDMKEEQPLPGFFGMQASRESMIFSSSNVKDLLIFWSIKEFLLSFKREVERYLEKLEVGQTYGPGIVNSMGKPTASDKAMVTGE